VEDLSCRLVTYPGPRPSLSLAFELRNDGDRSWAGQVLEPVVPWDLEAWDEEERPVRVRQPSLDLPLRPRTVALGPGEATELPCPIVLVFEEIDPEPFVWSLDMPPGRVRLGGTITVGGARCEFGPRWYDDHRT
jgi:hypothetical protein